MKFGHLKPEELEDFDWSLPPDHPQNKECFKNSSGKSQVFIGCAKWNMKSWIGIHYPEKTKERDFIHEYFNLFNSIELNSTFYRLSRSSISSWMEAVADKDVNFCPKWSRRVSHLKRLKDVDENIEYFMDSCALFKEKLGPSFLQMPDNFTPKYFDRLEYFFKKVPNEFKVHLEVRHADWFKGDVYEELCDMLRAHGQGLVITDVAGRRDVLHSRFTSDAIMIRFNGYGPMEVDEHRLDLWIEKINFWQNEGVSEIYFFFHHSDDTLAPNNSKYLINKINGSNK